MVIVELKLFISIILPLATILFIVKGDSRKIVTFLLFGIIAELVSNLIQNYLNVFVMDDLFFTANVGPVIEEVLKALPVLIFIFAFKPEKQLIYEVSIASGIGFAILENAFIIGADIYDTSLAIAFLRGIGSGMMHAVCTLAVGYGMSFIYKKRWFFIPGTFLFMFMAMVYHSIFNTLVQSQYQIIGLCIPIITFIPLIIRIVSNRENRNVDKKNIIKIVTALLVVSICTVSFVGNDGSRLTGGKNGIYGLSGSGMDIDDMVKAAMLSRQNEYDRMYKKEVRQEWLKEAYANLYREIDEFANGTLAKCKLSETFAPMQVVNTNDGVIEEMDAEKVVENAKAFVQDYNKLIDHLNTLYKEEAYSDYDVLTKEQEEEMSAAQIERWNTKAKAGLLNGNDTIGKAISKMRYAMSATVSSVEGSYNTMMSIGITSVDSTGHLMFDESKLWQAIKEDNLSVYKLFCPVANSLYDSAQDILSDIKSYAGTSANIYDGSYLGNLTVELKDKMVNFEKLMEEYREQMYEKYDAMDTALDALEEQLKNLGLDNGHE